MIQDIKNEAEKVVGKVKEKAGKLMDDNELELKGKVQNMKANIEDKVDDIKDKVYDKTNDFIDKMRDLKNNDRDNC